MFVSICLTNMNDLPHSDLWLAAYAGDTDEVRDLIERGADVNELDTDSDKPTPLWAACSTLSWPTAKVLIDAGADIESIGTNGGTLVLYDRNTPHAVKMFIEAGANLHAVDSKGNTLAHCAARGGDHETIVELFIRGMNMSQANTHGNTPLHAAAVHNKSEMILTLLDLHAGINTTNIFGSTPLHAAATYGAIQSAGALLHRNAALHIKNSNGRTAMDVARKKKHDIIVHMMQREDKRRDILVQPQLLAFAMGGHPRLGQDSRIRQIDPDVARIVADYTRDNFGYVG